MVSLVAFDALSVNAARKCCNDQESQGGASGFYFEISAFRAPPPRALANASARQQLAGWLVNHLEGEPNLALGIDRHQAGRLTSVKGVVFVSKNEKNYHNEMMSFSLSLSLQFMKSRSPCSDTLHDKCISRSPSSTGGQGEWKEGQLFIENSPFQISHYDSS